MKIGRNKLKMSSGEIRTFGSEEKRDNFEKVARAYKHGWKGPSKTEPKDLLDWRSKQKRGAIMKPSTFDEIVAENEGKVGKERAKKMAGAAYWNVAEAKYKNRKSTKCDLSEFM
jgi:hypothetical protein